jgi:hypothetical protein
VGLDRVGLDRVGLDRVAELFARQGGIARIRDVVRAGLTRKRAYGCDSTGPPGAASRIARER